MKNEIIELMLPVSGGAIGSVTSVISTISVLGTLELIFTAAIFALVGGLVGWGVKHFLDWFIKRKKDE